MKTILLNYLQSFFNIKRYYRHVSLFSFWSKTAHFSNKTYIASGVRLRKVIIGDYSRIRELTTIYDANIGKFASISKDVRIGVGQHPTNLISTNSIFYSHKPNEIRGNWVRPIEFSEHQHVEIGNDVWIGESVMILGNVKVGDGAIIAAKAVVTKDVPPYAIVAGIPAKIVKYRFNENIIKKLLDIQWWNLDDDKIEEALEAFTIFNINEEQLDKYFSKYNKSIS